MEFLKYAAITLLGLTAFCILIFAIKSGKPIRSLFINALLGIAALLAVNLTARFTGVHIPVNQWTAAGSAIYGIPAVCGFVLLDMIIK